MVSTVDKSVPQKLTERQRARLYQCIATIQACAGNRNLRVAKVGEVIEHLAFCGMRPDVITRVETFSVAFLGNKRIVQRGEAEHIVDAMFLAASYACDSLMEQCK